MKVDEVQDWNALVKKSPYCRPILATVGGIGNWKIFSYVPGPGTFCIHTQKKTVCMFVTCLARPRKSFVL